MSVVLAILALSGLSSQENPLRPPELTDKIDRSHLSIRGARDAKLPPPSSDHEYLTRVTRDLVGGKPTEEEITAFREDERSDKRLRAVDRLLSDPRYGEFWAKRFEKLFFGNPENLKIEIPDLKEGAEKKFLARFHDWFRDRLNKDAGWNEIVFEMVSALGATEENPALAYKLAHYRQRGFHFEMALGMTRNLLGIRLRCAECHDTPYDQWRVDDFYGMAAWFIRHKAAPYGAEGDEVRVIQEGDGELKVPPDTPEGPRVRIGQGGKYLPKFLFGGITGPIHRMDRNLILAKFMSMKANTQLPRVLANRVWSWLLGRGLVHPPDDFSIVNRPVSRTILEAMTRDLMDKEYSLKHLLRAIMSTKLYQAADPGPAPEGEVWIVRGLVSRNFTPPVPEPKDLEVRFDRPKEWQFEGSLREAYRYGPFVYSNVASKKPLYRVPNPVPGGLDGFLSARIGTRTRDRGLRWKYLLKDASPKKIEELGGGIHLYEFSGKYPCDSRSLEPYPFRILGADIERGEKIVNLRLLGTPETVEHWREAFLEAARSARLRP